MQVSLFEMLRDILPYLVHPNIWIRQAAVGMVVAVASKLDTVDVQVTTLNYSCIFKEEYILCKILWCGGR